MRKLMLNTESPNIESAIPQGAGGTGNKLSGVLKTIRFNQANFLIGILDNGSIVKGNIVSAQIGMEYSFTGKWERHPKWGEQFAFDGYSTSYPRELESVRAYLEENCKWVGPTISKLIVQEFGAETLDVCKKNPQRVADRIPGVTLKRAEEVSEMLNENEATERMYLDLKDILGGTKVSRTAVNRIVDEWGAAAPERIRENPYVLAEKIRGIGFPTADEVAKKLGFDHEGPPRIQAGTVHTLKEQAFMRGHTCLPESYLLTEAAKLLRVPAEKIADELDPMVERSLIVRERGLVQLQSHYLDERLISEKMQILVRRGVVSQSQPPQMDDLAEDQVEALDKATKSGVFILTGAPGTGKTFLIGRIIDSLPKAKLELAAPTGKAARRMTEQSGRPAQTMHKLLDPEKVKGAFQFKRNKNRPIEADIIVLDEVSMVDTWLMARFLDAVAPGTRLVLVGDTHQLPSIGPGNVLNDLIECGLIPCSELTVIKRQNPGLIVRNCHHIKNGEDVEIDNADGSDFLFIECDDEKEAHKAIVELVCGKLQRREGCDILRDVQVIAPLRKRTALSCEALNAAFQEKLRPGPEPAGTVLRIGDKVIQTKNNYDLGVINGDIGFVADVDKKNRKIWVRFDHPDRLVEFPLWDNDLQLAYAVTVHKFQGSEASIIVMPMHKCLGTFIMQRNLLYTAVSRAKDICILVGQSAEIPKVIKRNQQQRRYTRLREMI